MYLKTVALFGLGNSAHRLSGEAGRLCVGQAWHGLKPGS